MSCARQLNCKCEPVPGPSQRIHSEEKLLITKALSTNHSSVLRPAPPIRGQYSPAEGPGGVEGGGAAGGDGGCVGDPGGGGGVRGVAGVRGAEVGEHHQEAEEELQPQHSLHLHTATSQLRQSFYTAMKKSRIKGLNMNRN